jgi:hypothetical protein
MADFADPSFHEGNGSTCANVRGPKQNELTRTNARIAKRRLNIGLSSNLCNADGASRRANSHRHI